MSQSTIYALSSGSLPSGVAIIRISGPEAFSVFPGMVSRQPPARSAQLTRFFHPQTKEALDTGLVLTFPGPNSFTGEDCVELHCHGGAATVRVILDALSTIPGFEPAEAGAFSRRAFENGRLDLTELEGLSDLISAQTENQRRLALSQSGGALREIYDDWREKLIRNRALLEADIDFADEDDVPGSVADQVWDDIRDLSNNILDHLNDDRRGEIARDGFRIALLGPPNAGKSSLLNALAKRDVAIVTSVPGTTRDVLSVDLEISGQLVRVSDTAGLRESSDEIELEGMRRAMNEAREADLVLWLCPPDGDISKAPEESVIAHSKSDLTAGSDDEDALAFNTISKDGLKPLLNFIRDRVDVFGGVDDGTMTRARHRDILNQVADNLTQSLNDSTLLELRIESLRLASELLGRITGRVDVEDLLDVIFGEFCIGK